jgi:Chloriridovirus flap endonuclease 1-A
MGIKNLTKFIKENKKCKGAYVTADIRSFAFTKIAIDTPMYMYKYKSINAAKMVEVGKEEYYNPDAWLWSFIHLIYSLRKHDIHPIFVLEGSYPPEKSKTREARKKDREDVKKKTVSLEQSISSYTEEMERAGREAAGKEEEDGLYDRKFSALAPESEKRVPGVPERENERLPPPDLQEEWNKIARKKNLPCDIFDLESVKEQVRQRHRYDVTIRSRDYDKLKILLRIMKVPYIQAPMEAEALCSYFFKENVVGGIASNDSDILAYGCNLIVDFNFSNNESKVVYIDYNTLLDVLDLNSHEFLDFCIMCGTDYNDNIFRIGTVRSYDLIKKYGSIEGVKEFLDPTGAKGTILILNHMRVREIFNSYGLKGNPYKMEDLKKEVTWSSIPDFYLLNMFVTKINIFIDFEWINDGFEKCSVAWEDEDIMKQQSRSSDIFPIF